MAEWLVVGSRIKERRRALGMTQQALADAADLGRRTITRMECEPGVRFDFQVIQRVSVALGLPLELTPQGEIRGHVLRYGA
jgi:transcriptional regulator with XRE-family HTH domain